MYSEGLQVQQASAMCVCIELLIYLVSQQSSPSDSSPFLLVVIVSLLICCCCCWSFFPFPFLCPCSSVLVGVVRTAAAAVTGASVLLLVSPRLSSSFTSTLTLCSMMMTKDRDRRAIWDILDSVEVSVFYASISLCFYVLFLIIVMQHFKAFKTFRLRNASSYSQYISSASDLLPFGLGSPFSIF